MQDEVFPLNLVYEVPNQIMQELIALNWTIWSQTKVCFTKPV